MSVQQSKAGSPKVVSVIIPTRDRATALARLLDSLNDQTFPPELFEVIVVDDGSAIDPQESGPQEYPFSLSFLRQRNQGATIARNHGAHRSRGEVLVFIDDDVTISPKTLELLTDKCRQENKVIVTGRLVQRSGGPPSVFGRLTTRTVDPTPDKSGYSPLDFTHCFTGLLAIRKDDFIELGMFQDPTAGAGWPNWDDVDFGYRAAMAGFELYQCEDAVGEHWDFSSSDLILTCQRWRRASRSAVYLFRTHPGLQSHIPMFQDKTPIAIGEDSLGLIVRKLARRFASTHIAILAMASAVRLFERFLPNPKILSRLYRWMCGSYMHIGYREGLREIAVNQPSVPIDLKTTT